MFRYSSDPLIAAKEKELEEALINHICSFCHPIYSNKIENLFNKYYPDISYFKEFITNKIIIIEIPRFDSFDLAKADIILGFKTISKSLEDPIPYIKISNYPEYCFLLTNHSSFEESENFIIYYLNKFNKLKAFV